MLKMALFDCAITMKNVGVLTEDGGIGPLFSSPPRGIWQLKSTHPWEFAIQGKKNANAWGSAQGGAGRRWNWLMHKEHTQGDLWLSPCLQLFRSFYACFQTTCIVLSELASMGRNGEEQ